MTHRVKLSKLNQTGSTWTEFCQLTVGKLINASRENVMTDEITTSFATNVEYAASSSLACLLLIHLTVNYKLPILLPNEIWKNSPVSSSL